MPIATAGRSRWKKVPISSSSARLRRGSKRRIENAERVSSVSSRVTTFADDLESMMSVARKVAPTHHAYYDAETGQEFLIRPRNRDLPGGLRPRKSLTPSRGSTR